MKPFQHFNAQSLEQATDLLQKYYTNAKVVSVGTDLLGEMKDDILPEYPETLISLKTIKGLDYIKEENHTLKIGALTRLADIASSSLVKSRWQSLAAAAGSTASPHVREMGTIAGNLCQNNRCWYYWVPDNRFNCLRKGGKQCYALTGDGRYHSIFGSARVVMTPCSQKCPANVDIPSYMSKIREGNITAAAQILMRHNPLPAMTGRVCPHLCESECNRQDLDSAVSVRCVERYLGDYILDNIPVLYPAPVYQKNSRIAVIGSGPAGLTAACYLRQMGYSVTVYENMEEAGGLLMYGIPPYRLPKDIVRKQVIALAGMGIIFKTSTIVGKETTLAELMQSFAAVFLAAGAWKERPSGIKGSEYLLSGAAFLRKSNLGLARSPGNRVAVIGGGNVAIDVARSLLRLGSRPVIIYRRGRAEMPALKDEILKTEEENIPIQFLTSPVEAYKTTHGIVLKCQKMALGEPDASGRPQAVPVSGSEFDAEYDAVMTAIGETPDTSLIPAGCFDGHGRLTIGSDYRVYQNLFAGGDFVTGPLTVVSAVAAGRKAAGAIHHYLGGQEEAPAEYPHDSCSSVPDKFNSDYLKMTRRAEFTELPAETRIQSLQTEEAQGLETAAFRSEANRCLNCGCVAVNPSDTAPVLIALNAQIITTKRAIEAEKFFSTGINRCTVLDNDEIVKEISIPGPQPGAKAVFSKFALRKSIDFPVVNCAASIETDGEHVKSARICLNSVFNLPYRVTKAEDYITGKKISEATADAAADVAMIDALPLANNQYKIRIARALVKRAILSCQPDT